MSTLINTIKQIARTFADFTARAGGIFLRPYQLEPAQAILKSIINGLGLEIVVVMPRQSGKDEMFMNLIAYLLLLFSHKEKGIIEVNPTYKPQTINAIDRLENRLKANLLTRGKWKKRSDYMRKIGLATVSFLSGDQKADVVGATASLLLHVNEAQDILTAVFDHKFSAMVASTFATRCYSGTVWTSRTLLARQIKIARQQQEADGIQRLFFTPRTTSASTTRRMVAL